MTVFNFNSEDLKLNEQGAISESQKKNIRSRERLKIIMAAILIAVFTTISVLNLYWFFTDYSVLSKTGERVSPYLLLGLGIFGGGLSILFNWLAFQAVTNFLSVNKADIVENLEVPGSEIDYGVKGRAYMPYLKAKDFQFNNVNAYLKDIFENNARYRFFYARSNKSLLSVKKLQ